MGCSGLYLVDQTYLRCAWPQGCAADSDRCEETQACPVSSGSPSAYMNISPVGSVMSKPRKLLLRRHLQPSQQEADEEVNAQRFRDLLKVIQVGDSILEGSFSLRGYVLAESCQACGRQG